MDESKSLFDQQQSLLFRMKQKELDIEKALTKRNEQITELLNFETVPAQPREAEVSQTEDEYTTSDEQEFKFTEAVVAPIEIRIKNLTGEPEVEFVKAQVVKTFDQVEEEIEAGINEEVTDVPEGTESGFVGLAQTSERPATKDYVTFKELSAKDKTSLKQKLEDNGQYDLIKQINEHNLKEFIKNAPEKPNAPVEETSSVIEMSKNVTEYGEYIQERH